MPGSAGGVRREPAADGPKGFFPSALHPRGYVFDAIFPAEGGHE